ncbi:MAG TPA: hypothetical protein VFA53_06410 [Xanthobacteraceae bacterium]|nr:hypothetical protein [Xanthobacteraceae bacterium]
MDAQTFGNFGAQMQNLHVVAVLPPPKKDRVKPLAGPLLAGKARWNWRVSAICAALDSQAYQELIAPDGLIIAKPHLLKPASWESNPAEVERTEKMLREAERITGVPLGRVVLAGAHSIGRAFNLPVRHVRHYALVRRILRDNTEAFRIAKRLFRFADDMLEAAKPDLIYTFEWATPLSYCIWLAARRRGIPCVALRYSKITPDHAFWTTDGIMLNDKAAELAREKVQSGALPSEEAKARIAAFRNRPKVIKYIATRWMNQSRRSFVRWHLQNARVVVREFINGWRGQDLSLREPPLGRFLRYYHSLFLMRKHRRYFNVVDEVDLSKTKYVYFPLHKEAELAQTFQATLWHDQYNTVRVLASLLPHGYRLLVREHRMNLGHRPTRSYERFAVLPNVTLIDPFDSQFKYLQHAALVVTENGSSGWEGLLLHRRVLTLARTFYDGAGRATSVAAPGELNAAILRILNSEAVTDPQEHDRALGCMIEADMQTTFSIDDTGMAKALDLLARTVGPELGVGPAKTQVA